MTEMLANIKERIIKNEYNGEEQVRFSIIGRILQKLGWDIWDPNEVVTEFKPVPSEDSTKVDIALFVNKYQAPSVFIEIKAIGRLNQNLQNTERQLRDYNRNNTAQFSIITDGQLWRFYYSQTGGEFSDKCFKVLDLLNEDLESMEEQLMVFLSKQSILSDSAIYEAQSYLKLSLKQRAMEDSLSKAQRLVNESPFPSLPEALIKTVEMVGFSLTMSEASQFLQRERPQHQTVSSQSTDLHVTSPISINNSEAILVSDGINLFMNLHRNKIQAKGVLKGTKLTVLSGSRANIQELKISNNVKRIREELIKREVLIENNNALEFKVDYEFESTNEAAGVIAGYSINARTAWKNVNGESIKDLGLRT
ncbi:MAG: DUF4357 domain-containing protein [Chitinophagales bacterium]